MKKKKINQTLDFLFSNTKNNSNTIGSSKTKKTSLHKDLSTTTTKKTYQRHCDLVHAESQSSSDDSENVEFESGDMNDLDENQTNLDENQNLSDLDENQNLGNLDEDQNLSVSSHSTNIEGQPKLVHILENDYSDYRRISQSDVNLLHFSSIFEKCDKKQVVKYKSATLWRLPESKGMKLSSKNIEAIQNNQKQGLVMYLGESFYRCNVNLNINGHNFQCTYKARIGHFDKFGRKRETDQLHDQLHPACSKFGGLKR